MTHDDISDAEIEAALSAFRRQRAYLERSEQSGIAEEHIEVQCMFAALLASRAAALAEGKKVVAREPSEAMTSTGQIIAGSEYENRIRITASNAGSCWRAMWDAAP